MPAERKVVLSSRQATGVGETAQASGVLSFEALDVTGTHRVVAEDVQRELPAGAVAKALAARMSLPENVPWGLRSDASVFLNDDQPIGDQIEPGTSVTVTPKTHLGGR